MADQLQDPRRDLGPEVRQDEDPLDVRFASRWILGRDVLRVHGPELTQDEGIEQGAHVDDRGFGLLRESGQNDLNVFRDVDVGLLGNGLTQTEGRGVV